METTQPRTVLRVAGFSLPVSIITQKHLARESVTFLKCDTPVISAYNSIKCPSPPQTRTRMPGTVWGSLKASWET